MRKSTSKPSKIYLMLSIGTILLIAFTKLSAQTVTSLSALQTAINNASPGAVITLANGIYTASSDITINKQGTASQPITITAQTIGGAEIRGTAGFSIVSPARYIVIKGFKFTHNASQATMASGTSFCRWTRNLFDTPGDGEYLQINGNDHEVDYNTFQNKTDPGKFITVRGTGSQVAQRLWIHHNYFFNHTPQSGNGHETIQFGLSGYSLSNSNSILEYNLFEQCDGENEGISVKASQVTLRYNTFRDNPSQFTLRHGNRCVVNGNYFINTPGLRIFGDDHKIYSNHFENCNPAINIGNGDGEVADGAPLTSHDRPDRVLIAFNTLVNNSSNYTQAGRTGGLGATAITFANNIIQGGGAAASIAGPYTGATWSGNILFNTNGDGDMPTSGYTTTDPLLARDATGTFHLQAGSPAIGTATGSYATIVTTDMDGQSRTSPLDKGADEVSGSTVTAQILTPSMVGQNGTDTPVPGCVPASASADDGNVAANVLDGNLATRWSANGDGQWIQFCLDDITSISGVRIAFYSGDTRSSTFDVLTGNDGINWTTAIANRTSSGTTLNLETFTFPTRNAKYVRIVGHGNSVNLWNSYTEVEIITQTNAAPTVSITSPTNGATFTSPASITIDATAADSDGTITKVEFFNGSTKLGEDLTSPYSFSWSNVAAGSYTLTAKATDNGTAVTTSSPVNITVQAPPPCPAVIASADDGNVPANVLDNDLNTRWSASGDGQWIQFCLSDTLSVSGVQIAFFSGNTRSSTFDVLVGNNGTTWTTAASGRVSSGTSLDLETFSFTPVAGKYVRIVGHGNSANLWNSYTEVKILTGTGQNVTLTPVHDAYVRNGANADVTHGTTDPNTLITKLNANPSAGNDRHTYLRFDVSGVSGPVSSAVLRLYGRLADNRNNNIPISTYAVSNTTWTESTITWNNKPATGASLQTATVTDSIARYYTWDITSYIQSEKAAGRNIISLALLSGTATDPIITWNSKETGSNPPQLVIATASSRQSSREPEIVKTTLNNYPNPFNNRSTIAFSLSNTGHTQLSVYDINGRQVSVLVNAQLPAGNHNIQFAAPGLPAGVYLLKLVHGGTTISQKMIKQ